MSWLSFGFGYIFLYVVSIAALSEYPQARAWLGTVAQLVSALAVVWVVTLRRDDWRGCQRLFWLTIAVGNVLWAVGHIGWTWGTFVNGRVQWVSWHTVFSFCGAAAPLLALLARPHQGPRQGSYSVTTVDVAATGVAIAFLTTYFALVPHVDPASARAGWVSMLVLAQVQRIAMLAGMIAIAFGARRSTWGPTYGRLAITLAVGSLLRVAVNVALQSGKYELGSIYDLAWLVPFMGYAWAAAEAPRSEPVDPRAMEGPAPEPYLIAGVVALVPIIGYGVHMTWPLGYAVDSMRVMLTTLTVVVGLALVTIRMSVQRSALRRSDERMRLLAAVTEHTKEAVLVVRANGEFEDANDAFLSVMGYSRRELAATPVSALLAPEHSRIRSEIQSAVSANGLWRGTVLRRRKDGTSFPAACTVTCLRNEVGTITHFIGVERDVSDEMNVQQQLIHSERLAAMSEVVAGVAHEINNPLQAILGCTELLLDTTSGDVRHDLEIVRGEAVRAGQIVRNLLAFVHRGSGGRQAIDLNAIVQSTIALRAYHLQQNGIALDVVSNPAPLAVFVSPEEIQQALLNLLLNAEHAVGSSSKGGRIVVTTYSDTRGVSVDVSDDGPGIPPELRGRVFEPFFTTKEVGEGTGLGLSIALGIALAHGGTLDFRPSPEGGATFRLTLPVYTEGMGAKPARVLPGPERRALVVEDDPAIQHLLRRLLERRGYSVSHADDGQAALTAVDHALPELVVCDARMPRMNGAEFYRRACQMQPALRSRFVLMTGDAASKDVAEFAEVEGVPLLRKPFTAVELDAALARAGVAPGHRGQRPEARSSGRPDRLEL